MTSARRRLTAALSLFLLPLVGLASAATAAPAAAPAPSCSSQEATYAEKAAAQHQAKLDRQAHRTDTLLSARAAAADAVAAVVDAVAARAQASGAVAAAKAAYRNDPTVQNREARNQASAELTTARVELAAAKGERARTATELATAEQRFEELATAFNDARAETVAALDALETCQNPPGPSLTLSRVVVLAGIAQSGQFSFTGLSPHTYYKVRSNQVCTEVPADRMNCYNAGILTNGEGSTTAAAPIAFCGDSTATIEVYGYYDLEMALTEVVTWTPVC